MVKGLYKFIKGLHLLGDLLLLNISFLLGYYIKFNRLFAEDNEEHYLLLLFLFNLTWVVVVLLFKLYEIARVSRIGGILINVTKGILVHSSIVFSVIVSFNAFYFSRMQLLITYCCFGILVLVWRFSSSYFLKLYRSRGGNFKQVIIIGGGSAGNQIYNYLRKDISSGLRFRGFFDDEPELCLHKEMILGNIESAKQFALDNRIDEIFCALPLTSTTKIRDLVSFTDNHLIRFRIVPDFRGFLNKKVNLDFYNDGVPVLTIRTEPLENIVNRFNKRIFDIAFSLSVILFIFPIVYPILALLIKLSSKGPVIFSQKRSGRNNEEFYCYKFRTMTVNSNADSQQAEKNDSRITSIGKFLRKSNLDELPQFFNVLVGNMSVVGPRPHMLKHTKEYSMLIDKFMVRHLIKPGITGWAQINGYRGNTQNTKYMIKRVRYDMWYIENWSFLLDFKIIFLTVYNMLKGEENAF